MRQFFPGLELDDVYFLIIALISLVVLYMLAKNFMYHNKFAVRVKSLQERRARLKAELLAPRKREKKKQQHGGLNFIRTVVNKLNLLQQSQIGKITHLLTTAGYRSKDAIFIYAFFQLVTPVAFLILAVPAIKMDLADPLAVKWKPFFVLGAALFGARLPSLMVMNNRTKRYYAIQKGLSDALDLMLICAEAGLSLAASLDRVSRELARTYPELSEELAITSIELGFLSERRKALVNLAERVDMPEVRGVSSVLIQTEKYGTPIAQALRTLAAEFRTQRMMRAEQKAARLPAIMTVPMIVFILPTLFVVVLAPAIIKLLDQMSGRL